jgi:hypothetical protein
MKLAKIVVSTATLLVATSAFGQAVEVDPGVYISPGQQSSSSASAPAPLSHLTGQNIAYDVTHNVGGRQGQVTTQYTTLQGDLAAAGANLSFINTGPLTLPLLNQYDAWWIEEDFESTFSPAEKADLLSYVTGGGCVILCCEDHGFFTGDFGGINALFGVPYGGGGVGGITFNIVPDFLTDPLPVSAFPGPVVSINLPGVSGGRSLAPVPPAYSVVDDAGGSPQVAVHKIGAGGVVVLDDELAWDFAIGSADNRILANRTIEFCALGLVIEVDVDIKFCSDPNAFNCKKNGVLPVTIFGTDTFDVADIDISTLQLCTEDLSSCTGAPSDYSIADRGAPGDVGADQCAIVDGVEQDYLTLDGYLDLDAAFEASEVQAMLGDFCGADKGAISPTLVITGSTLSGQTITSVPVGDVGIDQLLKANK